MFLMFWLFWAFPYHLLIIKPPKVLFGSGEFHRGRPVQEAWGALPDRAAQESGRRAAYGVLEHRVWAPWAGATQCRMRRRIFRQF